VVEWWSGGVVEWWSGGAVVRWSGGAVVRWCGGVLEFIIVLVSPATTKDRGRGRLDDLEGQVRLRPNRGFSRLLPCGVTLVNCSAFSVQRSPTRPYADTPIRSPGSWLLAPDNDNCPDDHHYLSHRYFGSRSRGCP
jgi:hypothetical protein